MQWSKLVETLKDDGVEQVIAHPGISVSLFYDVPVGRLGKSIAAIVQDYLKFIAPGSFEQYYSTRGSYKKATPKVINSAMASLSSLEADDEFFEFHFGPGTSPGVGYGAHFKGSALGDKQAMPDETNLLMLEFPPDILDHKGVDAFVDFVIRSANREKVYCGIAGYAFQHPVMILREEALEAIARMAMRYQGFDISFDSLRIDMKGHVPNVSWLNILGQPLVKKLGGPEQLRKNLPKSAAMVEMEHGGVLIRAADVPIVGDVNRGGQDLKPLKDVAKVLKPLRLRVDYLGSDDDLFAGRWLSRFD